MPQLLHFLRVDQHTSFNAAGGALASAAAAEAEAATKGEGGVQPSASTVDATSMEKPFLNSSDKVLFPSFSCKTMMDYLFAYLHHLPPFLSFSSQDIDWGSIDVFTCSASCTVPLSGDGAYVEELVMMQPPVYQDH